MAKITAQGWGSEGTNALEPDYFERQAERWPGKHSSASTKRPSDAAKSKKSVDPLPAPKTVRRSKKTAAKPFTAGSAAGFGTDADL